jgi:hypothetical protein
MTATCHHCGAPFPSRETLERHIYRCACNVKIRSVAEAVLRCALAKLDAELMATRKTLSDRCQR